MKMKNIVIMIILALVFNLIAAIVGVWLWNDIVGLPWFNGKRITFLEMYGLMCLIDLLAPSSLRFKED